MPPQEVQEVKIGDRSYTVQPFRGFKFTRAGRIVARISKQWPEIVKAIGTFTRDYEENNKIKITRDMARSERFRPLGLSDEVFGDQPWVEVPQPPSRDEQILAVFPMLLDLAEAEVIQLLALIVAPNSELRTADQEGDVDTYLNQLGKEMMYEGELQELAEVGVIAWEVIQKQFEGKEKLQKLADAYLQRGVRQELKPKSIPGEPQDTPSPKSSPDSSDPSPSPSDGAESKSSSASPGPSSRPTPVS